MKASSEVAYIVQARIFELISSAGLVAARLAELAASGGLFAGTGLEMIHPNAAADQPPSSLRWTNAALGRLVQLARTETTSGLAMEWLQLGPGNLIQMVAKTFSGGPQRETSIKLEQAPGVGGVINLLADPEAAGGGIASKLDIQSNTTDRFIKATSKRIELSDGTTIVDVTPNAWVGLTYAANFQDFAGGFTAGRYRIWGGRVWLSGLVKRVVAATVGTVSIATGLPAPVATVIPAGAMRGPALADERLNMLNTGILQHDTASGVLAINDWVTLDGLSYPLN